MFLLNPENINIQCIILREAGWLKLEASCAAL
jgi:hypothetical protein